MKKCLKRFQVRVEYKPSMRQISRGKMYMFTEMSNCMKCEMKAHKPAGALWCTRKNDHNCYALYFSIT